MYNSLCCWIIAIYAVLCLTGEIEFDKKIFWLTAVLTFITSITTIIGLTQYPLAVRELGRGSSYTGTDIKSLYRSRNIASWSQLYGMVFILGAFAYFFKETKNKFVLLIMIVTELCILRSQLTFAILLSFATLALVLVNAKSKNFYIFVFAALIICSLLLFNLNGILLWMIDLSDQFGLQMLTPKLRDLYNMLVLRAATGDAAARIDLYTKSLSGFREHPLGLFWYPEIQATNFIGYHSEFFDIVGAMGIMGIILMIILALRWLKITKRIEDNYKKRFLVFMFVMFCIIFILNPVFYSPQIWIGVFALPAIMACADDLNSNRAII